jgi:hypothetical protein
VVSDITERLLFPKKLAESMHHTAVRIQNPPDANNPPSVITKQLDEEPIIAIACTWLVSHDVKLREILTQYATVWRHIQPTSNGNTIRAAGLAPSPTYADILEQLRAARIDGKIESDFEEHQLLMRLIEGYLPS